MIHCRTRCLLGLRPFLLLLLTATLIGALACEAGTGPFEPEGQFYEDIAGSYSAPISVTDQGHTLDVIMTLTVTQFGGELNGTYSVTGILDGAPITDTGTLTGFLADVLDPDVDLVFRLVADGRDGGLGDPGRGERGTHRRHVGTIAELELQLRAAAELDTQLQAVYGQHDDRNEHQREGDPQQQVAPPHEIEVGILEDAEHDGPRL